MKIQFSNDPESMETDRLSDNSALVAGEMERLRVRLVDLNATFLMATVVDGKGIVSANEGTAPVKFDWLIYALGAFLRGKTDGEILLVRKQPDGTMEIIPEIET